MASDQKVRIRMNSLGEGAKLNADLQITMGQAALIISYIGACKNYEEGMAPKPKPIGVGFLPKT